MTKCGRYGASTFDYSPKTIRETVKRSLERLKTNYLDVVYLHDVEFVCEQVAPRPTGNVSAALSEEAESFGLAPGNEGKIRGEGDQKVLDAFYELRKLKEEGLVKQIGITGIPRFFGFIDLCSFLDRLPSAYSPSHRSAHPAQSSV